MHVNGWYFASVEPYEGMKAFVEKSTKDYIGLRQKASDGGFSESFMDCIPKPAAVNGAKGILATLSSVVSAEQN